MSVRSAVLPGNVNSPRILWKRKVEYRTNKKLLFALILTQLNPPNPPMLQDYVSASISVGLCSEHAKFLYRSGLVSKTLWHLDIRKSLCAKNEYLLFQIFYFLRILMLFVPARTARPFQLIARICRASTSTSSVTRHTPPRPFIQPFNP
jgi:hypothetical protein